MIPRMVQVTCGISSITLLHPVWGPSPPWEEFGAQVVGHLACLALPFPLHPKAFELSLGS